MVLVVTVTTVVSVDTMHYLLILSTIYGLCTSHRVTNFISNCTYGVRTLLYTLYSAHHYTEMTHIVWR